MKSKFFKVCRIALIVNFSIMALVTVVKVYYAASMIDLREMGEVSVFLWIVLSAPITAVVVSVILLRYFYLGVRGVVILACNIHNHGIAFWHR